MAMEDSTKCTLLWSIIHFSDISYPEVGTPYISEMLRRLAKSTCIKKNM